MKHLYFLLLLAVTSATAQQKQFTVYFDFDVAEANTPSAEKLSDWMTKNKNAEILKVHGYADSTGNALYNVDLSERRAWHVINRLTAAGITIADDTELQGFGESRSVSADKAKDRKVEIYYTIPAPPKPEVPKKPVFTTTIIAADKGDKIVIPNLNFYNNSDIVLPSSMPVLKELLQVLNSNPKLRIDIQGHICCQKVETNQISLKRAMAVYNYLLKNGINKDRLSYKSFGSTRPIHRLPEKSEAERVDNRRVEIEIIEN